MAVLGDGSEASQKFIQNFLSANGESVGLPKTFSIKEDKINSHVYEFESQKQHYSLLYNENQIEFMKTQLLGNSKSNHLYWFFDEGASISKQDEQLIKILGEFQLNSLSIFIQTSRKKKKASTLSTSLKKKLEAENFPKSRLAFFEGDFLEVQQDENLTDFRANLQKAEAHQMSFPVKKNVDQPFLMAVEASESLQNGSDFKGRIETGKVQKGDTLFLANREEAKIPIEVRSINMFRKSVDSGQAGDNVRLVVKSLDDSKLPDATVLYEKENLPLVKEFEILISFLQAEQDLQLGELKIEDASFFIMADPYPIESMEILESFENENGFLYKAKIRLKEAILFIPNTPFAFRKDNETKGFGNTIKLVE